MQVFGLVALTNNAAMHKVLNTSAGMGVVQQGVQEVEGLLYTLVAGNMGRAEQLRSQHRGV